MRCAMNKVTKLKRSYIKSFDGHECGGKKIEMCYDGALVMPSKFIAIDQEEMSYIDGGDARMLQKNLQGLWNRSASIRHAMRVHGVTAQSIAAAATVTLVYAGATFGGAIGAAAVFLLSVNALKVVAGTLAVGGIVAATYLWNNRVFY